MDLWIRSQNREVLTKVNNLVVEEYAKDEYIIKNYTNGNVWNGLGFYKSKERALEVLDDIEDHIGFLNVEMGAGRFGELDFQADIVYEMPKE